MSMVGLALRISAVRALQHDDTIAGERVFDSAILPIDQMISDQPQPFVVISTEAETVKPSGRDLNNGDNEIDLLVECAMAKVVALPSKDDHDEDIMLDVFESDANLELGLAVLRRQIFATLFGRGGGVWGEVFRSFASSIATVITLRGASSKDGARFAGRQMVFTIKAIAEPAFVGAIEAGTPFAKFHAALAGDATLAALAPIITAAIENTRLGWEETYTAAAVIAGYTEEEAQAIGLAPPLPAEPDGETALLEAATILPDGWVADEDTIAEQLPEEPAP